jgi:hypothetical protein
MSDYKQVWETLSKVDVSEYVEEKMNLSYLSWSRAWYLLSQNFPDAKYLYHEPKKFEDGTLEVAVTITIGECSRSATLPVMDYKNNAIINPDSRQINDNKQRCFTKAIAMFGLGISLYMGFSDDLPDESKDKKSEEVKKKTAKKVVKMKEEQTQKEDEPAYDEGWAEAFVEGMSLIITAFDNTEELRSNYKSNAKHIAVLGEKFPDHKEKLDTLFTEKAEELNKKEG